MLHWFCADHSTTGCFYSARNGPKGIIAGLRPSDGEWIWSTLLETVEKRDPVLTFGTGGSYVFCRKVCHERIIVCLLSEYIY